MNLQVLVGSDEVYTGNDLSLAADLFLTFVGLSRSGNGEFAGDQVICKNADTGEILGLLTRKEH